MGNYKKQKQKLQMRLLALVALLGTAASLKLSHEPVKKALVKVERVNKIHHTFAKKRHQLSKRKAQKLLKAKWENLTDEQEQEIEDWVVEELPPEKRPSPSSKLMMPSLLSARSTASNHFQKRTGRSSRKSSIMLTPTAMVKSTLRSSWLLRRSMRKSDHIPSRHPVTYVVAMATCISKYITLRYSNNK